MNPPRPNFLRRWRRRGGWLAGLAAGLVFLAGCRTETKQKWLIFFFDGVPQPGATNVVAHPSATMTNNAASFPATRAPAKPIVLVVHPPYAKRDCAACHESQFSNAMRGKPGEVCFTCHKPLQQAITASKVKHQPVADGECTGCHSPHLSPNQQSARRQGQRAVPDVPRRSAGGGQVQASGRGIRRLP